MVKYGKWNKGRGLGLTQGSKRKEGGKRRGMLIMKSDRQYYASHAMALKLKENIRNKTKRSY